METYTDPRFIVSDIVEIMQAAGWVPTWPAVRNSVKDECGNEVAFHFDGLDLDSVKVEFQYALPGVVEIMNLDPQHGAARIARIVMAAAEPEGD